MTTNQRNQRTDGNADQTDVVASGAPPTTGRGLSVILAIVRAMIAQEYHRRTATRRKRILLLIGAVAFLPVIGVFLIGAHTAGEVASTADSTALLNVARWTLPMVFGLMIANGALLLTDELLQFEGQRLLLTTVPDRTLALGLLCSALWQIVITLGIPLVLLLAAFGAGAGSVVAGITGYVFGLGFLLVGLLVGVVCGLLGRLILYRVPISTDARELYGTIGKIGLFVAFGVVGAIGGTVLGGSDVESAGLTAIAPNGPPPVPLGYAADWLFVGTALVDSLGSLAILNGVIIVALIPISVGAVVRIAPTLWYADPAQPQETSPAPANEHASFLQGGRFNIAGQLGVVVDGLVRRARRRPQRFAFLAYHLFLPITVGGGLLAGGDLSIPTVAGGILLIFGLWFAGAVFCLNPLGDEGTMLSQLVLSPTPPRTVVRARVVAGTLIGVPFVLVGTVLLGINALSPIQAAVLGVYWLGLVPISAGLALGVGTLLPATDTRELLDVIKVRAPELLAIVYHAVLISVLAVAGLLVVITDLGDLARAGGAFAMSIAALVAGHGGYRFAVSGVADHGRSRRPDRVFAAELAIGVALAGLALSQTAGLGVGMFTNLDGFAGFVGGFLGEYAGWATVIIAYLVLAGRTSYPDISWPTGSDLRVAGAVATGLLVLWAGVSVGVSTLGLPFAEHTLGDVADRTGELTVVVALLLLINSPIEELLFRNIIQKRLAETLSRRAAITVATLAFGLVHLPVYATGGLVMAILPLILVTVAGGGFAIVYDRTGNVVPAALCHGLYNAVQVVVAFLFLA